MKQKVNLLVFVLVVISALSLLFYFIFPSNAAGIQVNLGPTHVESPSGGALDDGNVFLSFSNPQQIADGGSFTLNYDSAYQDSGLVASDVECGTTQAGVTLNESVASDAVTCSVSGGTIALGSTQTVRFWGHFDAPASSGNYVWQVVTDVGDTGSVFHYVGDDNDVNVTANVASSGPDCDSIPPTIDNVQVTNITHESARVSWEVSEQSFSTVDYGETTSYEIGSENTDSISIVQFVDLTDLQPFTLYHFRITAVDDCSNSTVTGDYTFSTTGPAGLSVRALPEKRFPFDGNFSTFLNIVIFQHGTGNEVFNETVTTDNDGYAYGIDVSMLPTPAQYDFLIKGYSHLKLRKNNITLTPAETQFVDFSEGSTVYLDAGDTNGSALGDNYVNGMDLGAIARDIYGNDLRQDLNYDGIVNGIEFAIAVTNLYKWGHD